jgi:leucyl aminopeptidase
MIAAMSKKTVKNFWGLEKGPMLNRYLNVSDSKGRSADVTVRARAAKGESALRVMDSEDSVRIVVNPAVSNDSEKDAALKTPIECRVRDAMGALISNLEKLDVKTATVNFDLPSPLVEAAVLGLELALYRYRRMMKGDAPKFKLILKQKGRVLPAKSLSAAIDQGFAVNVARHLTNLPPNILNPVTYAEFAEGFLSGLKGVKVEVWDEKDLAKENMNLHLAVGLGSNRPPRMVRIQYSGRGKGKPVAIVGKGVTFDSGGLDIKPAAGMRLMKKDMGGSAAALAIVYWAALSRSACPLDCYLALAENSISSSAFRPSDVITARNGLDVEIHNTDAEGRLVLADSLSLAVGQKNSPRAVVDLATLTGAIKVALGASIAGLFANDRKIEGALQKAGLATGDLNWPMPLYQKYRSMFSSNYADMINSPDGFAGAITAALFLERFVADVPWAHLDIYAWKDSAEGAWLESGGSGQGVLSVARWLSGIKA